MKSIFDKATRDEIINRINTLTDHSTPQWGKMTVAQMIKHCAQWDEMAQGKKVYKQSFIGKLFGKIGLKEMMKDQPIKKNLPTVPSFKIKEELNFEEEKKKWLQSINEYEHYTTTGFIHPFFGKMTKEDTGYMVYKHINHHLVQFNS